MLLLGRGAIDFFWRGRGGVWSLLLHRPKIIALATLSIVYTPNFLMPELYIFPFPSVSKTKEKEKMANFGL